MAGEPLVEELALDISPALEALQPLGDALTQLATDFATSIGDALASLSEIQAAPVDVAVTADTSELDVAIADALDAPRPPIDVEGDTTGLTDAIDTATNTAPVQVTVIADTAEAEASITSLDSLSVEVSVIADTAEAQDQIDSLGQAATAAIGTSGSGGGGGGEGLAGLEGAVIGFKAASGAAAGEAGGLGEALSTVGSGAGVAVGGLVAVGAFLAETTSLAADAEAQTRRFDTTFGDFAEQARNIDIGGLRISLEELGKQSGTTVANLEASATRIGILGNSAGAAGPKVANAAGDILGLAGALSVSNPRLGDAATVADTLTRAFATGRTRSLIPYGIALGATAIATEALKENTGKTAAELTAFDKIVAGINLTLAQQGNTLGVKFSQGVQGAAIQFRALKVAIEETLVKIGGPLLDPVTQSLQALLPVAQEVGLVLGQMLRVVLPLVADLAPALAPLAGTLGLVGDGLGGIADVIGTIPGPLVLVAAGMGALAAATTEAGLAFLVAAPAILATAAPLVAVVGIVAGLGLVLDHLGTHTQAAVTDTEGLAAAFTVEADAAGGLNEALDSTGKTIDKFIRQQLAIKTNGTSGFEILKLFGQTVGDVDKALQGSTDSFNKWYSAQRTSRDLTKEEIAARNEQSALLLDSRDRLEANAKATLEEAIATGTLTQAEASAVTARTRAKDGTRDFITVLKELGPTIDANTEKQTANATATALASPIYANLASQLAAGHISVESFATSLDQFGFSADAATKFATALQQKIQSTVSTVQSGLPSATAAFSAFQDGAKAAFTQLADDAKNGTGSVKADFDALVTASDPARLVENIQKQTDQINQFVLTLEILRSQGHERLANFFAEQGVGSLDTAIKTAGDANIAALEGESIRLNDAARRKATAVGVELATGVEQKGREAGQAANTGIVSGLEGDKSAEGAAKKKGEETGAAFQPGEKLKEGTQKGVDSVASLLVNAAVGLTINAGLVGNAIGTAFDSGLAQGITNNSDQIAAAAAAAAHKAEVAARGPKGLDTGSPSKVAIKIGEQFSEGLAVGIEAGSPFVASAGIQIADQLVAALQAALSAATSGAGSAASDAAQQALDSLISSAGSALPSVGTDISSFSQNVTSTRAAADAANATFRKATHEQQAGQAAVTKLQQETAASYGVLAVALTRYNTLAEHLPKKATDAQKKAVADAKAALSDAQRQYDEFARKLESAGGKLTASAKALTKAGKELQNAKAEADKASDPNTFTKNLNAQTAAGDRFAKDIAKLAREGFTDLAKDLAAQGPEAAGKLADAFAASPAKAKTAEAAIDHANQFAKSYQAELEKLFGPAGGAANAATAAGENIGQALTKGLQTATSQSLGQSLGGLQNQLGTGVPVLTVPKAAAPAPVVLTGAVPFTGGSSSIALDLTVNLPDGTTATAQTTIPFVPNQTQPTLQQQVRGEVHAS